MKSMRRSLALLLSLALILTCTIAGVVLPTSAEESEVVNMIVNGDFEGFGEETPVVKPWTSADGNANWEIAEGLGFDGSWGIKSVGASGLYLKKNGGGNFVFEDGATYRFSYKMKTNDKQKGGMNAAYVQIQGFQAGTGTYVMSSSANVTSKAYAEAGQWISCASYFVAHDSDDGKAAYLQGDWGFYFKTTADAAGMCFDDFELVKVAEPDKVNLIDGGDFEGAVDAALFGAESLNGSYSLLSTPDKAAIIEEPGNESNHVMQLKASDAGWSGAYFRGAHVSNGKTYLLTFDYKGGGWTSWRSTQYGYYGAAGTANTLDAPAVSDWTPYGVIISVVSGAGDWLFSFEKKTSEDMTTDTYVDNIRLVEYTAPESVALDKTAVTVEKDNTVQLGVALTPETATMPFFKWTTSDADVATVDKNGVVTAVGMGEATITAKADGFDAITCVVTVPRPKATAIQLDKTTASVLQSSYITLTATAIPADSEMPAVTWTSSNDKIAKVENGVVTGVKVGTAIITATAEGLVPVTCEVTVNNDSVYFTDFEDENDTTWKFGGETGVQSEDPTDENNHVIAVTNTNQLLTNKIPFPVKKGDRYVVRAKVKQIGDAAYTARTDFMIAWQKKAGSYTSAYVIWAPASGSNFIAGEWNTMQSIIAAPEDNTYLELGVYMSRIESGLSYLFDDFEIIKINEDANIMPNGDFEEDAVPHYMYRYFGTSGSIVEEADGNKVLYMSATNGVKYFQQSGFTSSKVYELTFRYKSAGKLVPYTPNSTMYEPDEGSSDNYTYYYPKTTGDEWGYARYVFSGGNAQYNLAFDPRSSSGGGPIYFDDIVIREMDFATAMTIDKTEATVQIGDTVELSVAGTPDGTYLKPVTWTSDAEGVATVEDGVVTTVGVGTATITATSGNFTQTCTIEVKPIEVTDVTLDAENVTLTVDDTHTLAATVLPENATDKTVTWTSNAEGVATVAGGVITAVAPGTATITATAGDFEATCTVIVRAKDYPIIGGAFAGTVGDPSGFTYVTTDEANGTDVLLEGDETNQYIVLPVKGGGALKSGSYAFDVVAGTQYDLTFKALCTGNDGRIKWHVITYKDSVQVEDLMGITEVRNKTSGTLYTYHGLFTPNKDADSFVLTFEMSQTGTNATMQPQLDDLKLDVATPADIVVTNGDLEGSTAPSFTTYTKADNLCVEENGNHYLKLNSTSGSISMPKIYGNFKAGVRYLVRMKVKNPGVDSSKLCLYFYGTHKNGGGSTPIYTPLVAAGTTEWTEVQMWVNCFADKTSMNGFYIATSGALDTDGDGNKTPEVWLDDMEVIEAPYGDSSINLMPDGDMEINNSLWDSAYTSYVQDPDDPSNRVLKMGANTSGAYCTGGKYINFGEVSNSAPEKGQIYKLSWWQKGTGTVTPDVYGYCTKLVAYGTPGTASNEWHKVTYYFSSGGASGQNTSYMALLRFYDGDVYIDNVELYEVSNALEVSMPDQTVIAGEGTVPLATFPENAYPGKVTFATDAAATVASVGSTSGVVTAKQGSADVQSFTVTATSDILGETTGTYTIDYARELITGGDFEDDYLNSTNWKGHSAVIVDDEGNTVLEYADGAGSTASKYSAHYYKGALYFKPNATYKVMYKVKGQGNALLSMTNTTGVSLSGDYRFESATEVTEWQDKVAYITTGDAPSVSLSGGSLNQGWQFHTRNESLTGEVVYFDDIRIELTGFVDAPEYIVNGEISVEATENVEAETEVTVEVLADEGYLMKPGSLKYTTTDGKVYNILNKELVFNPANFGSREFSGDTFTFTMPKDSVELTAEFVPVSEQNFAMDTVGTGLRVKEDASYDGIRFLTRMNVAFSFNDVADAAELELGLTYQGTAYTVKEIGSMIIRENGTYDAAAMDPTDASTYWRKSVAYTQGGNMTLLDYTNRYIDFTVVVTKGANISEEDFAARKYTTQGYLILTDGENDVVVKCDNTLTNSVNGAKGIVA